MLRGFITNIRGSGGVVDDVHLRAWAHECSRQRGAVDRLSCDYALNMRADCARLRMVSGLMRADEFISALG